MAICMGAFSCNDAFMKLISGEYSIFQAIFLRGIFATLILGAIAWKQGILFHQISQQDKKLLILRFIGEIGGALCFLTAIFNMPLANASAILQVLPLAITFAASLFLGEAVGWRRYLAILIGFIGVIIIIRPGSNGFNTYAYYAVGAVIFISMRDLATRRFSMKISVMQVSFLTSLVITVAAGILALTKPWIPVTVHSATIFFGAAFFLIFAYLTSVVSMRVGEIGFVSPFRYTILLWALMLGFFLFGEVPDAWTLVGTLIIVTMGIFTFYREQKLSRQ